MGEKLPKVKLLPKTKRLKQLIKEHGETWVLLEQRKVLCFNNEVGAFIASAGHSRWVRLTDIEPVED